MSSPRSAACEGDWSMENSAVVGERIWNMERQFNLAAGFTAKDDDLPPPGPRPNRPRPVRPRAWSTASTRCCPSTTRSGAGRQTASRTRRPWTGWGWTVELAHGGARLVFPGAGCPAGLIRRRSPPRLAAARTLCPRRESRPAGPRKPLSRRTCDRPRPAFHAAVP